MLLGIAAYNYRNFDLIARQYSQCFITPKQETYSNRILQFRRNQTITMRKNRVCPVERARSLDLRIRRWFQNPQKILYPYINDGMTVLDLGCGPGFFSLDLARMVGKNGRVIASDLQDGMLQELQGKIEATEYAERIVLHKCEEDRIGIADRVDLVLAFYVIHEIPDKTRLFREIASILNPNGIVFISEPPFHVSGKAFRLTIQAALEAGLAEVPGERPRAMLSKTAVLRKA